MDRVNRLLRKVTPRKTIFDRLSENNPWIGKEFRELMDLMHSDCLVPDEGPEVHRFNYALLVAFCRRDRIRSNMPDDKPDPELQELEGPKRKQDAEEDPMAAFYKLYNSDPDYNPTYIR